MWCLRQLVCFLVGGHVWHDAAIARQLSYFNPEDEPIVAVRCCQYCHAVQWKN